MWNSKEGGSPLLLRSGGGDADGIFDIAVPLFAVGGGGHAVVRHQADGVVDGVHEDADIFDHGDMVLARLRCRR